MARCPDDWNEFVPTTMVHFLCRFTLHDSWLKELIADPKGQVTLTIGFDLHWNNAIPSGYDTLFLRFDRVCSVQIIQGAWNQPTIDDAHSEFISASEREKMLNSAVFDIRAYQGKVDEIPHPASDDTLTRTQLCFVNWGRIKMLHGSSVRCAVVNDSGAELDVSAITASQDEA